jgi:hypothetical protein
MFDLEKIENIYLLILRYMIVAIATLAISVSIYMMLNGFVKSLTGDPDLPTKSFVSSANVEIPTTKIALTWISEDEKKSMQEYIASNKIKGHYNKSMQSETSLQALANKFLTNAFDVSYNVDGAVDNMLYGEDSQGVSWSSHYTNEDSSKSDNLNTLYVSMLGNHLENLDTLAPWFKQLSDERRKSYQDHLLKSVSGNTSRYLSSFNDSWVEWIKDRGEKYDEDLLESEMTRASASISYYSAGVSFAVFLAIMFMSLIAFIERNTSKIANK